MANYTLTSGLTLSGTSVFSGGTYTGSTITLGTGDTLTVSSGGTAEALTDSGATISVVKGGTTSNLVITAGGTEILATSALVSNTSVLNGGTIIDSATVLTDTGLYVGSGGTLDVVFPIGGSQTLPVLADTGAVIEFGGVKFTTAASATAAVTATPETTSTLFAVSGGTSHEGAQISGGGRTFTTQAISVVSGSTTNYYAEVVITCYAAGTNIQTATGNRAIETIQAGDTVTVLRDGAAVQEAVKWVGRSSINLAHHAHPERAAPIRVKAGALAENTPARDLLLSPEHCLVIDNRCIPVKLLINGASIAREFPAEPFTYYHIELETHGILIAEGAQSESYLDTGNRASFDNADMPRLLHPEFELNAERWAIDGCAPLAKVPDEVAPVWQALAERAVQIGMTIPTPVLTENPDLHLMVDGKRIQPTSDRNNRYVFMVPEGAKSVTLASRFCIPADKMVPGMRDTRRLGVSVEWMAIRSATSETILPADHPGLAGGWNDIERDGAKMWRWTDGAATIPWENIEGSGVLTIRCSPVAQYPLYDEKLRLVA